MSKSGYTTISIPVPMADRIKELIVDTEFKSVSSFSIYVLRQVLASLNDEEPDDKMTEQIRQRLKALGYID